MPDASQALPADADSRSEVRKQITSGAAFDVPYALLNVLATIIASYGLLENSAAVVIGAMLIAQLLGPIAGIALALVAGDARLLGRSLASEAGGVFLVLLVSFVLGKIHHDLPLGSQVLSRTSPNILDLIIALAGGTAGAYATISPKLRSSMVGVAVATALVPPLSVCGLCLARGELSLAWGGFLLFFANFIAIQFAFSVVLGLYGLYRTLPDERASRRKALGRQTVSVVLLVALAIVLGGSFTQNVASQREEAGIRAALQEGLKAYPGAQLADLEFDGGKQTLTVTAVVRTSGAVSPVKVAALQSKLPKPSGRNLVLQVRSVITKTATAHGYVQDSQAADTSGSTAVDATSPASTTDTGPTVPNTLH
jgi:uncharacterized hydrophobic protein (TIGR00271 family)